MRGLLACAALAVGIATTGTANAKVYVFNATGTLGDFYTADGTFDKIANPPTTLKNGDKVSVSFSFDTSKFSKGSYTPGPDIAFYDGYITDLTYNIGSYAFKPTSGETDYTSFQIWNNRLVSGPTDSVSFGASRYIPGASSPVSLGSEQVFLDFGFSAFDFTAKARGSTDVKEEPPLSAYGSQSGFIGLIGGTYPNQIITTNSLHDLQASITPAVPEPATWAMMILGMGAVGCAMRRQKVTTRVSYAV
jgi:hypothetical protein